MNTKIKMLATLIICTVCSAFFLTPFSTVVVSEGGEVEESVVTVKMEITDDRETVEIIDSKQYEEADVVELPEGHGTGVFEYPLIGRISSYYGQRWGRLHGGIDIAANEGTEICASDNGKVIFAGEMGSYGLLVKLDHSNGYVTYYAHCSKLLVNVGDCVKQGEVIALVGNTGNSTGPHCHFEIRKNNERLDPMNFLDE